MASHSSAHVVKVIMTRKTMKKKPIVVAVLLAITVAGCGIRGGCPASGTLPCTGPPMAPSDETVNLPHKQ
jgi:hypothetical protein